MNWKLVGVVPEGKELRIDGVNVWSQKWTPVKGEFAEVIDPSYHQTFRFNIYTIKNGEAEIKFAAGEFSNMVYGFYVDNENANTESEQTRR
jgi:hypothetical protein